MKKNYFFIPIFLQAFIYLFTFCLFKIFAGFEVRGLANLTQLKTRNAIFALNHASEWDGILLRVALPFFSMRWSPMHYVAMTRDYYNDSGWRKILYGGLLFRLLAAYPKYPGHKNYEVSLQNHLSILRRGGNLCIFPEGIRTKDGTLGEAHGGVAFLTRETNIPVVPVAVEGLVRLTARSLLLGERKVIITLGTPLAPQAIVPSEHPTVSDYKAGAQMVLNHVARLLNK